MFEEINAMKAQKHHLLIMGWLTYSSGVGIGIKSSSFSCLRYNLNGALRSSGLIGKNI